MNLKDYLNQQFVYDLKELNYKQPNSVIKNNLESFNIDKYTIFFGGPNWKDINNDIKLIDKNNYENFFLSLFTIITIDLTFFTYFKDDYDYFRNTTRYPKFGWTGFGVHYENPIKILDVPQKLNLIDESKINYNEYSNLFYESLENYLKSFNNKINIQEFIEKLINDKDFRIKNNLISSKLLKSIIEKHNNY